MGGVKVRGNVRPGIKCLSIGVTMNLNPLWFVLKNEKFLQGINAAKERQRGVQSIF